MFRRDILTGAVSVGAVAVGGCSSNSDTGGGPSTPPPGANPKTLLPEAPDGWTRTQTNEESATMVGAQAGYGAAYEDPGGERYGVEVLRWAFPEKATQRGEEIYTEDWPVYVTLGNFGFAGQGPDVGAVHTLLDHSPALPAGYSKENNLKT